MFQFHKVQLKGAWVRINFEGLKTFQFHKVQLKA